MSTSIVVAIIIVMSLMTTLLTLSFSFRTIRANRQEVSRRRAVLTNGAAAKAVVNDIRQTNATLGGHPEVLLDVTLTMENGEEARTVMKTVIPIVLIPQFQKHCVINVKYMIVDQQLQAEPVDAYFPSET